LAIGSVNISILDANNFGIAPIPGNNYTVVLQAGESGAGDVSSSIFQSALIPSTAASLVFEASVPSVFTAGWQVSINGQVVPVSLVGAIGSYYGVFSGDISSFAGHTDQLEFTALAGTGPTENLYLDAISFSPTPVPEPNSFGLFALGASFVGWRYWWKCSRLI
jgi:hypothetical protein